jgi:hypothetical protein
LFKFDAGYQQSGEYIVATDQAESAGDEEGKPRAATKWVGQTLAVSS